jgi:flagellar basal body-associated protein FliL
MRNAIIAVLIGSALLGGSEAAIAAPAKAVRYGSTFVPLDEITTPIFDDSRIEGALSVTIAIEAKDAATAAALKTEMPILRASALAATIEFSRLYASGLLPVNARQLSADLNAALKRAHPGIRRVLITRLIAVPA